MIKGIPLNAYHNEAYKRYYHNSNGKWKKKHSYYKNRYENLLPQELLKEQNPTEDTITQIKNIIANHKNKKYLEKYNIAVNQ